MHHPNASGGKIIDHLEDRQAKRVCISRFSEAQCALVGLDPVALHRTGKCQTLW